MFYILNDDNKVVNVSSREWAAWMRANPNRIRLWYKVCRNGVVVSTIFRGYPTNQCFETLVLPREGSTQPLLLYHTSSFSSARSYHDHYVGSYDGWSKDVIDQMVVDKYGKVEADG